MFRDGHLGDKTQVTSEGVIPMRVRTVGSGGPVVFGTWPAVGACGGLSKL